MEVILFHTIVLFSLRSSIALLITLTTKRTSKIFDGIHMIQTLYSWMICIAN